jgi:hypothetical protein
LKQFLIGPEGAYQGKLISDGSERYDDIAAQLKLLHFGCLTHRRTMFVKARKVSQLPSIEEYIGPVYHIEGQIKALREEYEQRGQPCPSRRCCSYPRSPSPSWRSSKCGSMSYCPAP